MKGGCIIPLTFGLSEAYLQSFLLEVWRLQYASSSISLLLEPVVQCFPYYIHFFSAFIESILSEAFR